MTAATEGTYVKVKFFGRDRTIHRGSNLLITPRGTLLILPPEEPAPGAPANAVELAPDGAERRHNFNPN